MRYGPAMCVPGVFSPDEEPIPYTQSIVDLLLDNPELEESLKNLIDNTEFAWNKHQEDLAWECFEDRLVLMIRLAKRQIQDAAQEKANPDE